MDNLQRWWGSYFELDTISNFISSASEDIKKNKRFHEIFITWAIAKFLSWQNNRKYYIGFPSIEKIENTKLIDYLTDDRVLDGDNFDTIIYDSKIPKEPLRIQVKRFLRKDDPSTTDFFGYVLEKVDRYGVDSGLTIVFHLGAQMKLDFNKLAALLQNTTFTVGSIIVLGQIDKNKMPFLFSIWPHFTGQVWIPEE